MIALQDTAYSGDRVQVHRIRARETNSRLCGGATAVQMDSSTNRLLLTAPVAVSRAAASGEQQGVVVSGWVDGCRVHVAKARGRAAYKTAKEKYWKENPKEKKGLKEF